jgi:hypothetical protein
MSHLLAFGRAIGKSLVNSREIEEKFPPDPKTR